MLACCLPGCRYYKAAKLADALVKDEHYTVDEKQKSVLMTEDGYEAAEDVLEVRSSIQCATCHKASLWVVVVMCPITAVAHLVSQRDCYHNCCSVC